MNILIKIIATILVQINLSSLQVIPVINISQNANATASIAANTSQDSNIKISNDLVQKAIIDAAQNRNSSNDSQSVVASGSVVSGLSPKNSGISKLPVEILHEAELDKNRAITDEENTGEVEEFDTENEAAAESEGEINIDDILLPEIEGNVDGEIIPVTPEDADEDEDEEGEGKEVNTPKHPKGSKKSKRIEKIVCQAEFEVDPEEPIFAEKFVELFE